MAVWRMNVFSDMPGGAGRCINSWHIRTGNLITTEAAAVNSAAQSLRKLYVAIANYNPSTTGAQWKTDFAVNVQTGEDIAIDQTKFAPVTVSGGASIAPPHLAICISWKTSIRARRGRGRTFVGPLVLGSLQTDGSVVDATLTTLTTAGNTLVSESLTDNDWAFGVWGLENPAPKDYAGDYNDLPHVIRDFTGFSIQDKFAVMRSRRP